MIETRDRALLERLLRRDPVWGAYALGDLDEPYFARTRWILEAPQRPDLVLVYETEALMSIMTFGDGESVGRILDGIALREPVSIHFPESHHEALSGRLNFTKEPYLRLGLTPERLTEIPTVPDVAWQWLTSADVEDAQALYVHYPENFFDPTRVEEGRYLGARADGVLVAVGGTHVWSAKTRVAAIGDIVTEPSWRGRGLGSRLTWQLCRELFGRVDLIVLNVAESNGSGRRAYAKVGFGTPIRHYEAHDACRIN